MDFKKLGHYFYLSFVVSLLLWAFQFWANFDFFHKGFFTSLLLVGNFKIWILVSSPKNELKFLPLFFLFQVICLLGSSFEFKESFPFILALVPILAGLYFLMKNSQKIILLACFVISIFVFKLVYNYVPFSYKESLAFFMILSWISGVLLFHTHMETEKLQEKYLFHDLLNHTHGLSLFFESHQKKGLTPSETNIVTKELESFQNILRSHFGKNPTKIRLDEVLRHVESLCDQFLSGIKFEIKTNGNFREDQISFNEFFRAMGNILKNVSDSKSSFCEILLENQDSGISIIVKNNFSPNLGKHGSGIGLKSTGELLEKAGGIFCFFGQGNLWVSRIYLPFLNQRKKAA
jgi:hypothetical protein